jgi:hypothetical protein
MQCNQANYFVCALNHPYERLRAFPLYGPKTGSVAIPEISAGQRLWLAIIEFSTHTHRFGPFRFLLITFAGWMNQRQLPVIDYLRKENRVLCEQLGQKRLRFNDDQRRRLAARAKSLGRKLLREVATIVTPEIPSGLASSADPPEVRR